MEIDKIYNMDCLEGMTHIPDGGIDAIICDLPYGTTANKWDSIIPLDQLWQQYKRIIKKGGPIVLFAQCPFDKILGCSNLDWLKYEWIWEKEQGTGILNSHCAPLKIHEVMLVFSEFAASPSSDERMIYNPQMMKGRPYKGKGGNNGSNYGSTRTIKVENDGFRYPTDILSFDRDSDAFHPTQKPVDLLRYLIRTYSNEGDTILDNCMGSGTTAVACIKEKRHFIGFELNEEYWKKACQRIDAEQRQLSLF
jgi:site-specific DNA-methyltransferase (adenine-specific)